MVSILQRRKGRRKKLTPHRLRHDRLKQLRLATGYTQEEVAKLIDGTPKQYSSWETGKVDPTAHFLYQLARLFKVTADYLIGLSDDPHGYPVPQELSPLGRQIVDAMDRGDLEAINVLLARYVMEQKQKKGKFPRKKPPISN